MPYRTWVAAAISLWEQRAAVARLREQGRTEIDETALFAMVEQMRHITEDATAKAAELAETPSAARQPHYGAAPLPRHHHRWWHRARWRRSR
ncbi:hypothetical protein [Nocardia terpenica]|uniref:hypothetical protein n=1 Tax=Nocardia terpenica TaxID=455432 RepID=UPI0015821AF0|nr:hypothetical protein [Nocardia terpenica]